MERKEERVAAYENSITIAYDPPQQFPGTDHQQTILGGRSATMQMVIDSIAYIVDTARNIISLLIVQRHAGKRHAFKMFY